MSNNQNLDNVEPNKVDFETESLKNKIVDKNQKVLKNKVYYNYGDCSSPSLIRLNQNDITNELNQIHLTDDNNINKDCDKEQNEEIENLPQDSSFETLSLMFGSENHHHCMVNYGQDDGQVVSLEKSFDISPVLTTDYDSVSVTDDVEHSSSDTSSTCPSNLTSLTLSLSDYDNHNKISGNQCNYFTIFSNDNLIFPILFFFPQIMFR